MNKTVQFILAIGILLLSFFVAYDSNRINAIQNENEQFHQSIHDLQADNDTLRPKIEEDKLEAEKYCKWQLNEDVKIHELIQQIMDKKR